MYGNNFFLLLVVMPQPYATMGEGHAPRAQVQGPRGQIKNNLLGHTYLLYRKQNTGLTRLFLHSVKIIAYAYRANISLVGYELLSLCVFQLYYNYVIKTRKKTVLFLKDNRYCYFFHIILYNYRSRFCRGTSLTL